MTTSSTSRIRSVASTFDHDVRVDRELGFVDKEEVHLLDKLHRGGRALLSEREHLHEDVVVEAIPEPRPGVGLDTACQFIELESPDPLAVHPVELLGVEGRGRVRHPFEVELGDELVEREDLPPVGRRPTKEREIIEERLWEESLLAELLDRNGAMALRELGAVGCQDQRQMRVHRLRPPTERLAERKHPMGGIEEILATDDMGDLHVDVVHRIGQEEDR